MTGRSGERVAILGAGSWGTTLAALLAGYGHETRLWSHRAEHARDLRANRENTKYLPGVPLPVSLRITADLDDATRGVGVVVIAVPTHTVRGVASRLGGTPGADLVLVNTSKGIEEESLMRMSEVIKEATGGAHAIVGLLGPSHAEEVSRGVPTSVVAASDDADAASRIQRAFSGDTFRVYTNPDVVGVEIATALKNVIAIAAGIVDGIGYGDNTKAALLTRGLAEIARLGVALGARPATFSGLAGVGDLVVTCLSRHSRNRHVGEAIGRGADLASAQRETGMVAEGVRTTRAAHDLSIREGIEMPIASTVHSILFQDADPRESVTTLMTRPLRAEASGDGGPTRR